MREMVVGLSIICRLSGVATICVSLVSLTSYEGITFVRSAVVE